MFVHDLDRWAAWMAAGGRAPGTVRLQRYWLERAGQAVDLATASSDDLAAWLGSRPDWSPATRKCARAALRSFYAWAVQAGVRPDNPSASLRPVRQAPPHPKPTPEARYLEALAQAGQGSPERTMVLLAATCGLRRAEVASLHRADYADGLLYVLGKGNKRRTVPVVHPELRRILDTTPDGWLFPGRFPGTHLTPDNVGRRLSRLLGPGWSAHSLRHRFATKAYAGGQGDLFALQRLLGHASPETTARYVAVDLAALQAAASHAA